APIAVDADRRRGDQNTWAPLEPRERVAQRARAVHAAAQDPLLLGRGPAPVDRLAGEMDRGVERLERCRLDRAAARIPSKVAPAGRRAACEPANGMPFGAQPRDQRRPDEPTRARDEYVHPSPLARG